MQGCVGGPPFFDLQVVQPPIRGHTSWRQWQAWRDLRVELGCGQTAAEPVALRRGVVGHGIAAEAAGQFRRRTSLGQGHPDAAQDKPLPRGGCIVRAHSLRKRRSCRGKGRAGIICMLAHNSAQDKLWQRKAGGGRHHVAGNVRPNSSTSNAANAMLSTAFASNCANALRTEGGGPRSNTSRGGGRSKSMSCMQVTRENMT